jgi:hypothetical protein
MHGLSLIIDLKKQPQPRPHYSRWEPHQLSLWAHHTNHQHGVVKLLWNSTIITPGAQFGRADIINMYLDMPLDHYEYMKMPLALLPTDIIEYYNLLKKALHGYIYAEIRKGM